MSTWPSNSDIGEQKRGETTQKRAETATATEKSANTIIKYRRQHGFLLNRLETTGFEIQTRQIRNHPSRT